MKRWMWIVLIVIIITMIAFLYYRKKKKAAEEAEAGGTGTSGTAANFEITGPVGNGTVQFGGNVFRG